MDYGIHFLLLLEGSRYKRDGASGWGALALSPIRARRELHRHLRVSVGVLIAGSCLMQAGVQGTLGVTPAHLNELSPDDSRSIPRPRIPGRGSGSVTRDLY